MPSTKQLLTLLCVALLGCSSTSLTARSLEPEQAQELIDVVSFDTGCPRQGVEIVDIDGNSFHLEACGTTVRYLRTDSVFHSADTGL